MTATQTVMSTRKSRGLCRWPSKALLVSTKTRAIAKTNAGGDACYGISYELEPQMCFIGGSFEPGEELHNGFGSVVYSPITFFWTDKNEFVTRRFLALRCQRRLLGDV